MGSPANIFYQGIVNNPAAGNNPAIILHSGAEGFGNARAARKKNLRPRHRRIGPRHRRREAAHGPGACRRRDRRLRSDMTSRL